MGVVAASSIRWLEIFHFLVDSFTLEAYGVCGLEAAMFFGGFDRGEFLRWLGVVCDNVE
ncbi:hypothetical protein ACLOJK_018846 [Asimina triloba]